MGMTLSLAVKACDSSFSLVANPETESDKFKLEASVISKGN